MRDSRAGRATGCPTGNDDFLSGFHGIQKRAQMRLDFGNIDGLHDRSS
jgi:hypothetical protein